jgi:lipopolysaccharide export LptBFGC system permease protein LptF
MFKKLNKKGSHVGLVVSFLIFIVFIAFFRIILEPSLVSDKEKKIILDDVENELIESASSNLKSITIHLNNQVNSDCISLGNFTAEMNFDRGIIIKNRDNEIVQASYPSGNSNTLQIERNDQSEDFFKIYNSNGFEEIESSSVSCESVEEEDYTLGGMTENEYIFDDLIVEIIKSYSASPKFQRKNSPGSVNIGILFVYANGTEVKTTDKNATANVFIKESPIEYVDQNGGINPGKLTVKVW